jgi:vacuolar-type H+-ATPase subunit D/Vma8
MYKRVIEITVTNKYLKKRIDNLAQEIQKIKDRINSIEKKNNEKYKEGLEMY